jgi:lipoic acid synthetase
MLGMGEGDEEIFETLKDLSTAGCDLLTLGQYLAPSPKHYPVARYATPDEFEEYAAVARAIGLKGVASAPRVRSSYKAAELLATIRRN